MITIARFFKIFIVITLCIACNTAIAIQPEIIYEKTYIVTSKGIKTGYIKVSQRKTVSGEGLPVIITKKHIEQKFKRSDNELHIVQDQTFVEDEAGKPVYFLYSSTSKGEDIQIRGDFDWKSNQIVINSKVNDIKELKIFDFKEKVLFPYAIEKLYAETRNNSFRYYSIEPGVNLQVIRTDAERLGQELIREGNLNEVYTKYSDKINIFPNTDLYTWRDEYGVAVKEYTSLLDMSQVEVHEDQILDITSNFDVFSESLIRVNKSISDPDSVSRVMYKINMENMDANNFFLEDEFQKVILVRDNAVYLKVEAEEYGNYKFVYPVKKDGYEKYLKSGPFIITDSKAVKDIAEKLCTGEDDAFKIAKKMNEWVYDYITDKSFALDFAGSVKVLETKAGDCTEHSVLLASLLRAAGIPAKIVVGLVYTNDPADAFVYHMWVKAFVGKWINLDPSLPYKNFTPLHIAIAQSPLNNISARSELLINVINSFSRMDIEILNVSKPVVKETAGRPEIKVNLDNEDFTTGSNVFNVNIDKFQPKKGKIQEIKFPDEEKDYIKEAMYSFTRGETEQALAEFKEFYKTIDPEDDFLKMKLALKLINLTYFNFAAQVLEGVRDRELWGRLINELKVLYLPNKFFPADKAKLQYTAFYSLNYKNSPDFTLDLTKNIKDYDYIYYLRAEAFSQLKEHEKAEKEIEAALEINPENLTYNLAKIKILSDRNEIIKAQQGLNYVNMITQKHDIRNKDFRKKFKSRDYWLKVKQFRENAVLSKYYEAYYYLVNREINSALLILNKLITKNEELYVLELTADAFYEIDQFSSAEKYYKKVLEYDENNLKSNLGLGNIAFLHEKYQKAEKYYQKILKTNPSNIDALLATAKLHIHLKNETKALDYFKQVLKQNNSNTEVIYNIGIILANKEQYSQAERMFRKVLSAEPMQHYKVWLDLAKVQLAQGDYSEAVKSLNNVKYIDETNPYYYFYTGVILKRSGNPDEAKKFIKRALELEPDLADKL